MNLKPYIIDIHHHIVPIEYISSLKEIGITESAGRPFPKWNQELMLEFMNRMNIATSFISLSCPGVYFGHIEFAKDLARKCNEISAQLMKDNPQRFGAFATLPLPDVKFALREIEYALDILKLDGITLFASIGDRYLGDSFFDEIFKDLNQRKAIVFIHPKIPPDKDIIKLNLPSFLLDFIIDTTRAVTNLLFSGTLERYPDIRFIISHAGGAIPYLVWRLSLGKFLPGIRKKVPKEITTYLKNLYYDTALSASPHALRSLQELVDPSHILFGSDYPFAPEAIGKLSIEGLRGYNGFDEKILRAVKRENALKLFPRLK